VLRDHHDQRATPGSSGQKKGNVQRLHSFTFPFLQLGRRANRNGFETR
jgi:hypothetical protein